MIRRLLANMDQSFARPRALWGGLSLMLLTTYVVVKICQTITAGALGLFTTAGLRHVAGPAAIWLGDLVAAVALGAALTGISRISQRLPLRRATTPLLLFPCLALILAHAVAQIVFYRLYQSPLTVQQLQAMGPLTDLGSAVFEATPWWAWALFVLLPLGSVPALPFFVKLYETLEGQCLRPEHRSKLVVPIFVLGISPLLLPPSGCFGLEKNGALSFMASGLNDLHAASPLPGLRLGAKPRFDRSPISERSAVEATATLIQEAAFPQKSMNVVLFILESASTRLMGRGAALAETMPQLAQLAQTGVSFERYYAITPVSMKSLVSITCSIHPYTRALALTYVNPGIGCADLASLLKAQGYATGLFHAGHFHYSDKDRFFRHRRYDVLKDADKLKARKRYRGNAWGADDRAMIDDSLAWIRTLPATTPFLLTLIPVTPHYPYTLAKDVAASFPGKSIEHRYRSGLHFIDSQIGRVVQAVADRGSLDDTLFVVVGDHGEAFGEHPGHTMHGSYIYEEAMHVPLVLSNRRLFKGATSKRLGNHVDLAPTILDALGLPPHERHEGRSLLRGFEARMVHFYSHYAHHQVGLRDGRWKYIRDRDLGVDQLFDLESDPGEQRNMAAGHGELVARYRASVDRFESFYQELIPHYEAYWSDSPACPGVPVCWLDSLEPVFEHGKLKRRRSSRGGALRVAGETHAHGLGVHAPSILRYSLEGQGFKWLDGAVGHDDDIYAGQLGETVGAEIFVDDQLVFSSGKLRKGDAAKPFKIEIEGARTLELHGHDLDGIGYRDMIDWLGMRLSR